MERIRVKLERAGSTFDFELCHRRLEMGPAGEIDYYWMDCRAFRRVGGGPNYRACKHLRLAVTERQALGPVEHTEAEVDSVLTELHALLAADRGPQAVFRDAFLKPVKRRRGRRIFRRLLNEPPEDELESDAVNGRDFVLPASESDRLERMALRRDLDAIYQEVMDLFIGDLPAEAEKPAFQAALRRWMCNAVVRLRTGGREDLQRFLGEDIVTWIKRYRRRGHQIRPRMFVNMLCVEAKASFYACYVHAWAMLIPWLIENCKLDERSARFLNLWHDFCRFGGRDPIWEIVWALHPVSERIMNQVQHRQAIGEWLLQAPDQPDYNGAPYWRMVSTILTAGHEYDRLREQANAPRTVAAKRLAAAGVERDNGQGAPTESPAELFDAFTRQQLFDCPQCSGQVTYAGNRVDSVEGRSVFLIEYTCRSCGYCGVTDLGEDAGAPDRDGARGTAA